MFASHRFVVSSNRVGWPLCTILVSSQNNNSICVSIYIISRGGFLTVWKSGQFAIDFFVLRYATAFVVAAIVIACVAVTAALFIFFKLREKWANQWYKRVACALLMAVAVCGKHMVLEMQKGDPLYKHTVTTQLRYALHRDVWY